MLAERIIECFELQNIGQRVLNFVVHPKLPPLDIWCSAFKCLGANTVIAATNVLEKGLGKNVFS
jgi:hypothetical protein